VVADAALVARVDFARVVEPVDALLVDGLQTGRTVKLGRVAFVDGNLVFRVVILAAWSMINVALHSFPRPAMARDIKTTAILSIAINMAVDKFVSFVAKVAIKSHAGQGTSQASLTQLHAIKGKWLDF